MLTVPFAISSISYQHVIPILWLVNSCSLLLYILLSINSIYKGDSKFKINTYKYMLLSNMAHPASGKNFYSHEFVQISCHCIRCIFTILLNPLLYIYSQILLHDFSDLYTLIMIELYHIVAAHMMAHNIRQFRRS